jgi:magnesium transporter
MQFEISKEFIDFIKNAVEEQNVEALREQLSDLPAVDIDTVLDELDTLEAKYILTLLDIELSAEIIVHLNEDIRPNFLKSFSTKQIADFIKLIDSDDAADILNEQDFITKEEVIAHINDEEKVGHILDLLRYEEDIAGGLMAKELIKANLDWNVTQCIEEIRRQAEKVDKVYSVYVVDDQGHLKGRVSIKKLLLASDTTLVSDLYDEDLQKVDAFAKDEDVARLMQRYDLVAIPVVNIQNKLIGRITIDDIIDVVTEQAEHERQIMAGISKDVESDSKIWDGIKARLPWLLIGMGGGLLGARLIGMFEDQLTIVPSLAFFIPLITATGGNVGIQSSSIVVQDLAEQSSIRRKIFSTSLRSTVIGLLNGVIIASFVFIAIYFLGNVDTNLAVTVGIALFSVVVLASLMGTITPLVLDRFGINPAVASGPFITTTNDLLGILVYFSVAYSLLP